MIDELPKPKWLLLSERLTIPVVTMGLDALQKRGTSEPDTGMIPYLALVHVVQCMEASWQSNLKGHHSASICLVRQCIEGLTLVDLGLQSESYRRPLLTEWKEGNISHGNLRAKLEKDVWLHYGTGLWDEPWSDFFGNLARAVQPYAHYTPELMGWQFSDLTHRADESRHHWALLGPNTYDALKASRITLLHSLTLWALGRLLVGSYEVDSRTIESPTRELGIELSSSNMLFKKGDWGSQLLPHMLFVDEDGWRDE